jgi:hypothetical protein
MLYFQDIGRLTYINLMVLLIVLDWKKKQNKGVTAGQGVAVSTADGSYSAPINDALRQLRCAERKVSTRYK